MHRVLDPNPPVPPSGSGGVFVVALQVAGGGALTIGPQTFVDGLLEAGEPVGAGEVLKARASGRNLSWWRWEPGIKVEWPVEGPPTAFVEEKAPAPTRPKVKPKPVLKKRKPGRPKKSKG